MHKPYAERRFPCRRIVLVSFDDDAFIDGMDGLNVGHALYRARLNWDGATITDLGADAPTNR